MTYVDGFVVAVPTEKRETYRQFAEKAAAVFKEFGALKCVECWGDDVPDGKVTSFPLAVRRKDDETVVFSWIPLALARRARRRNEEGHGRSSPQAGRQPDTVRRQAADLWRL